MFPLNYVYVALFVVFGAASFYEGWHQKSLIDEANVAKQEKSVINTMNKTNTISYNSGLKYESEVNTLTTNSNNLNEMIYINESNINANNIISDEWVRYIQFSQTGTMPSLSDAESRFNAKSRPPVTASQELLKETQKFEYCQKRIVQLNNLIDNIYALQAEYNKNLK